MARRNCLAGLVLVVACTPDGRPSGVPSLGGSLGGSTSDDVAPMSTSDDLETSSSSSSASSEDDDGSPASSESSGPGAPADEGATEPCNAPDVLVVLDRTQSMHRRPDGSVPVNTAAGRLESKWYVAIDTLERVTGELEGAVNFGLELFPREPVGDTCVTLQERIAGTLATNPDCEAGELLLSPQADAADAFAMTLDHETTRLCDTTPVGYAIETAIPILESVADPEREQFVVLVTDGNETCDSTPTGAIQQLAAAGVHVYAVGFGDIVHTPGHARLNRMACAGQTAIGFPAPCVADDEGNYDAADPDGDAVYLAAEDADALDAAFATITAELCCGSVCVP